MIGGSGNDRVLESSGDDIIIGVDPNSNNPGMDETDTLNGGAGYDTLVIGDQNNLYYVGDGLAVIEDLESGIDKIQLTGGIDYKYDFDNGIIAINSGSGEDIIAVVPGGYELGDLMFV